MTKNNVFQFNPYGNPIKVAIVYAVLVMLWIGSSNYVNFLQGTEELEAFISDLLSGTIFTIVTSVLLMLYLKKNNSFIYGKNEELSKSEVQYRTLSENLDMFISRFDLEKKYIFLNKQAKKMFMDQNLSEGMVIGRRPTELSRSDDAGYLEGRINEVIESKKILEEGFSLDDIRHYTWKLIPEFDNSGSVVSVLSILFDITDIQKMRDELEAKSAYLNAVIETSPLAIFDLNRDGTVASLWNRTAEKMFGWSVKEALGSFLPIIQNSKRDEYLTRLNTCFTNETLHFERLSRINRDNREIIIDVTTCPLYDSNNNIDRALAFIEDVTAKKQAEDEVRKLSEIVKQSPDSVMITDMNYILEYVNPAFTSLTGYTYEEAVGKSPISLLHGEIDEVIGREISESLVNGKVWKGEFLNTKKNGEKYWASLQIGPIKDENGKTIFTFANERDITQKKKRDKMLEDSLREKENSLLEKEKMLIEIRKLSEALKQNPLSVLLTDIEGKIEYVNPAFEQLSGYSLDEAYGMLPIKLLQGKNDTVTLDSIGQTIAAGSIWKGEFLNTNKVGKDYWSEVQIGPIKDENGKIISSVAIEQDITEKKLKDIQLRQSLHEKEVMLKEIHHRVKNNLQVVSSLLKMQSEIHLNPETVEALKTSRNRISSMALVHENLYRTTDLTKIDMRGYINNLTANIFSTYGINHGKIKFSSNVEDVKFGIDTAIPLGLMMNEIITNSLKYAFPGDKRGEISLNLKETEDQDYSLSIKDNGIGLPHDFKDAGKSTLGKQLIKLLCGQMDGSLTINNGVGAEFIVNFKEQKYKARI